MSTCLLCGRELPPTPWWRKLVFTRTPTCRNYGLDLDICWAGFARRMGIDPGTPRPQDCDA